ncbi:hypothetical protein O4J56_14300 [Nocardiopsis sp. RSe5-2]|uniref:Secreted protein n=1 Tax=Nocardiopsis endophytica TaxID=3018445 RepID=A0ABT4U4F4_9ACTN|nr:hypothetical protein [Nocardiopsis endophytica]MDA2811810.1 hypothetical protein [Nocardiopsis endophytica]
MSLSALFGLGSLAVLAVLTILFLAALLAAAGTGDATADEESVDDALSTHGVHGC